MLIEISQHRTKFRIRSLERDDRAVDEEHGAGCDLVPGRSECQVEPDLLFLPYRRPCSGLEGHFWRRKRVCWGRVSIWHCAGFFILRQLKRWQIINSTRGRLARLSEGTTTIMAFCGVTKPSTKAYFQILLFQKHSLLSILRLDRPWCSTWTV